MREHPIPQDLTGYRFHIVGNMTLKQFVEVAAGTVVGVILYNTNLIPIVKWPLIFLAFAIGAAMAWLPIEDRPLDHWVTTFFSILYRPTKFFWKKHPKIPQPFLFKPRSNLDIVPDDINLTPARQARIREYITSVKAISDIDPWEKTQAEEAARLLSVFDEVKVENIVAVKHLEKPNLNVRIRDIQVFKAEAAPVLLVENPEPRVEIFSQNITQTTQIAAVEEQAAAQQVAAEQVVAKQVAENVNLEQQIPATALPAEATSQEATSDPALLKIYEGVNHDDDLNNTGASASNQIENFSTSQNQSRLLVPKNLVITNQALPFPAPPTQPNKLVGMVLDENQKLVPNAIVEIKNLQGLVARAVKTNALGQFFIATPLESGTYIVSAEKTGLNFSQQQLTLDNQIVPPLQISGILQSGGDTVALGG